MFNTKVKSELETAQADLVETKKKLQERERQLSHALYQLDQFKKHAQLISFAEKYVIEATIDKQSQAELLWFDFTDLAEPWYNYSHHPLQAIQFNPQQDSPLPTENLKTQFEILNKLRLENPKLKNKIATLTRDLENARHHVGKLKTKLERYKEKSTLVEAASG